MRPWSIALPLLFVASTVAAQDALYERYVADGQRFILTFTRSPDNYCDGVDFSATTRGTLEVTGTALFAETFVYGNRAGYIYWIARLNGPHEVFFAYLEMLTNCVIVERQLELRTFTGDRRLDDAAAYYNELMRSYATPAP